MAWTDRERVVVPVDLSLVSYSAINVARDFVVDCGRVHVIHVLRELNPYVLGECNAKEYADERHQVCSQVLEYRLSSRYEGIQITIAIGDPGREITAYAGRIGADLIVMTSHGRQGDRAQLIGSVTERVLRLASCPVLVVKPSSQ